jgi:hypothetical protein
LGVDFIVSKYIRKNNYETAYFDQEWIVLNTDNYTLTKLNETGGFCWSLLEEPQSIETLTGAIVDKFDSEEECVQQDIKTFILDLFEYGLIKHVA